MSCIKNLIQNSHFGVWNNLNLEVIEVKAILVRYKWMNENAIKLTNMCSCNDIN